MSVATQATQNQIIAQRYRDGSLRLPRSRISDRSWTFPCRLINAISHDLQDEKHSGRI